MYSLGKISEEYKNKIEEKNIYSIKTNRTHDGGAKATEEIELQ